MKGSYILLIELATEKNILIGKLGYLFFPKAFYAYVGSAMDGLEARLARHLRKEKKLHWHIDYLLKEAAIADIILCFAEPFAFCHSEGAKRPKNLAQGKLRMECFLARALAKEFQTIPGFGSSDCKCQSHLYFGNEKDRLKAKVTETINKANTAYKILLEIKS
ncbi:MAG: GIY-YIG nuclease family protein [Dehalococcoidia bacterium]|nr:GIY-YIG nuclease family protein [Dehalococcoidia bacterium]